MEQLIIELVEKFKGTVTINDEQLCNAFENRLFSFVKTLKNSNPVFVDKDNDSTRIILKSFAQKFIDADLNNKKKELLKDVNFEKIVMLSGKAYRNAEKMIQNGKDIEEFDFQQDKEKLQSLLNSVEEWNREEARQFVSEGILDLNFIQNPQTKVYSLRLGRYVQKMKRRKIKEIRRKDIMQNTSEKFLPVGTVVMLKEGKKRLMITGFCASQESDKGKMWDYSACLYPEGILQSNQTALFDHEQIETIYHYGLIDGEEQEFMKKLNDYLENGMKTDEQNASAVNNTESTTLQNEESNDENTIINNTGKLLYTHPSDEE